MRTSLHCAVAISVATAFMVSAIILCGCDKDDELLIELEGAELEDAELEGAELEDYTEKSRNENVSPESGSSNKLTESKESRAIIYVHVCGCVNNPGVYAVDEGTRLVEVIKAAGGYTYEADGDYLNLAASVADGQKIYVPSIYDESYDIAATAVTEDYDLTGAGNYGTTGIGNNGTTGTGNNATTGMGDLGAGGKEIDASDGKVNINSAGKTEFMTIKGIGEKRADAIIKYRNECGGFSGVEDLLNVPGIKEGIYNKIKEYLTI